jgi:hypothetical protein
MDNNTIVDSVKHRINHPFFGIFVLFFIWNYESFLIIFIGEIEILKAIEIAKQKSNLLTLILFPTLATILYICSSEWIMYVVDQIQKLPKNYRMNSSIEDELRESETRKKLMSIKEEELEKEIKISKMKESVNQRDIDTIKYKKGTSPSNLLQHQKFSIQTQHSQY